MNKLDQDYQELLLDILGNGVEKKDRTGTGTLSVFGRQIRHDMRDGFPLLTTKKMAWKTMTKELLWFLSGDTNIKWLVENNCNIWNGDAYKAYLNKTAVKHQWERGGDVAEMDVFLNIIKDSADSGGFGDLGPVYGKQWRSWFNYDSNVEPVYIDQIKNLIDGIKENPDSRRLMVSAWNVGELDQMVLPPCHYGFQVYTRELGPLEIVEQAKKDGLWKDEIPEGMTLSELQKGFKTRAISLMWNQRSVDTFLGLPFNIASYGLLLLMLAKECNMVPDQLIGNLGDVHLYKNHVEQAIEQTKREPYPLPDMKLTSNHNFRAAIKGKMDEIYIDDFILLGYQSHPSIKAPLSN
jgi:thymidylate synthase